MSKAIVLLKLGNIQVNANAHASLEHAAERWGADLVYLDEPLGHGHPYWQKVLVPEAISQRGYEQVLQIDLDMVIRADAPSLFDLYRPNSLGAVRGTRTVTSRPHGWFLRWEKRNAEIFGCNIPERRNHTNGGVWLYDAHAAAPVGREWYEKVGKEWNWKNARGVSDELCWGISDMTGSLRRFYLPCTYNVMMKFVKALHPIPFPNPHKMRGYIYHFNNWQQQRQQFMTETDWRDCSGSSILTKDKALSICFWDGFNPK